MQLYFSLGACSLSPHIVLREMGAIFTLKQVDSKRKTLISNGTNYLDINPKGPIIIQYLVDQSPDCPLIPPLGGLDRYRTLAWLNNIGSDLRKGFGQIFNPKSNAAPDASLFTMLNWAAPADVDLSPWPALGAYLKRVAERPAVSAALAAEGLGAM
jgi:glutathione S-transferase